jgi:hypothetical protein
MDNSTSPKGGIKALAVESAIAREIVSYSVMTPNLRRELSLHHPDLQGTLFVVTKPYSSWKHARVRIAAGI